MKLKGISPLIAAVLLIAFTMAIAGILAIWATTFSQTRLQTAGECPGLTVQDISFKAGSDGACTGGGSTCNATVTARLLNQNRNTAQTGVKLSVLYVDGTNAEARSTAEFAALEVRTVTIKNLRADSNTTVPTRVEIVTTNCPTTPVTAIVP